MSTLLSQFGRSMLLAAGLLICHQPTAPAQDILIPANSLWRYVSESPELPEEWRHPEFPDSEWMTGLSSLGFGRPVTTVIDGGPAAARHPTVYFRAEFDLPDPGLFESLVVAYRRDDGLSIALNGVEQLRDGLPGAVGNPIAFTQTATSAADNGATWFTNRLNVGDLLPGRNVVAVEVHQTSAGSSDLVFDLLLFGFQAPVAPSISFLSPTGGLSIPAKTLFVDLSASDPDHGVASVQLFDQGVLLTEMTAPPYRYLWTDISLGEHQLTAQVTDNSGATTVTDAVLITIQPALIPLGSSWRFLDDGEPQDPSWMDPMFDDSGWSLGTAELGFGEGDEVTTVSFGADADKKHPTTYFRHFVEVADPATFQNLVLSLRRDDGAIVYVNGSEVFRTAMPAGSVQQDTFASIAAADTAEQVLFSKQIPPSVLFTGPNLIAVEVHQSSTNSSDLSFDLLLRGNVPAEPPVVSITNATSVQAFIDPADVTFAISASDPDSEIVLVELLQGGVPVDQDPTFPYAGTVTGLTEGTYVFSARATDETGMTAESAPFELTILASPVLTTMIPLGSVWRYLDDASDQGTAWITMDFDDSGWLEGQAELGFGDNRQVTPLTPGAITYYFRHEFMADPLPGATNLYIFVRRDDGVVFYLNGEDVGRENMPAGEIDFDTPAGGNTDPEADFRRLAVPLNGLREGRNVIAAEVHQTSAGSSDVSFDMSLIAYSPPDLGPRLDLEPAGPGLGAHRLIWTAPGYALESSSTLEPGSWVEMGEATSPHVVPANEERRFFRLRMR